MPTEINDESRQRARESLNRSQRPPARRMSRRELQRAAASLEPIGELAREEMIRGLDEAQRAAGEMGAVRDLATELEPLTAAEAAELTSRLRAAVDQTNADAPEGWPQMRV